MHYKSKLKILVETSDTIFAITELLSSYTSFTRYVAKFA